jgi:glycerophosphoryl diester phosphodiesterase
MRRTILLLFALSCGEPAGPVSLSTADFDCTAPAVPERTSPVPLDCIVDPACEEDLIAGHRGAGGTAGLYAPENSLEAIRFAILIGLDVVELDVREAADDRLVLMHDAELARTTGDPRLVREVGSAEIGTLPLKADGFPGDFSCARPPLFEEALALAKDRINIDVDTKTSRSDLVAVAIRDAGMIDQAFVSAADTEKLVLARQTVPEIKLQARPDTIEQHRALLEQLDRPPEILEIPLDQIEAFVAESTGSKLFANVFLEDIVAYAEGDLSAYLEAYAAGADVLQSEFPTFVVKALGRERWASLPPHRKLDIGDSPLLR